MNSGGELVQAKNAFIHSKFSKITIDYDIGVILLRNHLNFTELIQPLLLADSEPGEGKEVKVSGWGYVKVRI